MKKQVFFVLTVVFLSVVLVSGQVNNSKKNEPTAKEAIKLIFANGDIPLTVDSSCKDIGSSKNDKTIADYLSGLLSFQTEEDSSNRIGFSFKEDKGKRNEILWICDLMFFGKGKDEEIWSWGIRFTMRDADRKLIRNSIICLGSG